VTWSKTRPGSILPSRTIRQQLVDVRTDRSGSAAHGDVAEERRLRRGHRLVLGKADAADRAAWASDADGREHRLLEADGLEHGVDAEAVGELAHAFDRLVAALADDVGRAELSRQRDPGGVAAKDDDLLRAEAPGGDHPAKADSAVTDDGDCLSGARPWRRSQRDGPCP
jgi:hypothetical protein